MSMQGSLRRELRAVLKQGELIVRAARPEGDGAGASLGRGERLVVFVHGFMARGPVWGPMREAVVAAHDVETIDLSYGPLESFEAVCDRVRRIVERLHADRPVTLVGHSLGGLVSRRIVQTDDAVGGRIDRLVTLASPHEGTRAARLPAGPLVAAIRPGSSVIQALERDRHLLERVHRVAVVASRDRMITPPSSAAQLPGAEVVWLDVGHNEILFDADAIALVKRHVA
ncbi:MAG: alpha/beta fold hydrolase [Deltaproteobacteria bacterium]|nr:alpha/beta fold hydrolase [Deltaproteobacteria bacterium]